MKPKLLLATANPGKLREMRAILAALGSAGRLELLSLADVGIDLDVPETGSTYRENAALKAETYARLSGLPVLSDDSGLEVEALGGAPGLHSKRYLPVPGATDADRRAFLLSNLAGKPQPWTAAFRCVTAAMPPGGGLIYGLGVCPGVIVPQERGTGGFGYDPIFALPGGRTMAELEEAEKNRVSHRGLAVADIHDRLLALLEVY